MEPVANVTEAPAEPTPFSEIGTHLVAEREHAAQQRLDQLEDVPDEAPARSPEQTTATSVPTITETVTLGQDEVACRECGRANEATRRFCRYCGGTLPAFHDDRVVDDDEPVDEPLIRRLLGTTRKPGRDGRTFGQRRAATRVSAS